jgi:DNA polymerase-3 subunit delta'
MTLAENIAAAILCEEHNGDACGKCRTCKMVMHHNHPDVIYVNHEKPSVITVDEIRNQLISTIFEYPYSSEKKIYIIDEAEKMNEQAQNALLKTIEEPPEYAVIFLLTNNLNSLLPTILSRCIKFAMKPVNEKALVKYLMEQEEVPDYIAEEAAAFSQGNAGMAINLVRSSNLSEKIDGFTDLIASLKRMDIADIADASKKIIEDKERAKDNVNETLQMLREYFRDVLLYKAVGRRDLIIFKNADNFIMRMKISYRDLNLIFDEISETERKIRSNLNAAQALELLLLDIREKIYD